MNCDTEANETAFKLARLATGGTVAGVIVEPIQGEGGVNIAPADYLPRLRQICDTYECLLILDEVQTGMGRTGRMFGAEHTGVVPDILILAKAFGGGVVPIGAMVAQPKWWGKMEENPFLLGSSTFGGNPLCSAGAIAAINTTLGYVDCRFSPGVLDFSHYSCADCSSWRRGTCFAVVVRHSYARRRNLIFVPQPLECGRRHALGPVARAELLLK